jgi:hypothetical protein
MAEPEQTEYLVVLQRTMEPKQVVEFLRPRLERRPISLQWHRGYQNSMEAAGLTKQCEQEYAAMLAKEPANAELIYLAGRATQDIDAGLALTQRAAAANPPCGYAFYSLCGYHLENGNFAQAAEFAGKALPLLGKHSEVHAYCREAYLANGQLDKVTELAKQDEEEPFPACLAAYSDEIYAQTMRGKRDEASSAMDRLKMKIERIQRGASKEHVAVMQAQMEYCTGNVRGFVDTVKASQGAYGHFSAHVCTGELDAADADLQGDKDFGATNHLVMYIAATWGRRDDLAQKHLAGAIANLRKGSNEDRLFAAALVGKGTMPLAMLLRQRNTVNEKLLLLVALGLKDPAARPACFELARKLNYDRRFPYLLLNNAMAGAR